MGDLSGWSIHCLWSVISVVCSGMDCKGVCVLSSTISSPVSIFVSSLVFIRRCSVTVFDSSGNVSRIMDIENNGILILLI